MYESLSPVLLDDLDEKGYIFPIKYSGRENGIYISKDQTCSVGDYRTIARNRTINKSRRAVRAALVALRQFSFDGESGHRISGSF